MSEDFFISNIHRQSMSLTCYARVIKFSCAFPVAAHRSVLFICFVSLSELVDSTLILALSQLVMALELIRELWCFIFAIFESNLFSKLLTQILRWRQSYLISRGGRVIMCWQWETRWTNLLTMFSNWCCIKENFTPRHRQQKLGNLFQK